MLSMSTKGTELPALVSATGAAHILGIHPPHLARLRKQGRLPEPIPVLDGYQVYRREEIESLAAELAQEKDDARKEREQKVAARA